MPSPREAYLRHATYFLNVARSRLNHWTGSDSEWSELEEYLQQLRNAWKWLSQDVSESLAVDLRVAYGELAWQLLEITHDRLSKLALTLRAWQSGSTGTEFQEQTIMKLDQIIATQLRIQSALPDVSVLGHRNVIADKIVNSRIYTGDISISHKEKIEGNETQNENP
jgi:hypothetical protein